MAVFTPVSPQDVSALLQRFDLGELRALDGIAGGIENTNYFVDTSSGRYVLTLFERLSADQLPFYLGLMRHLAARGLPVPQPMADRDGAILHQLHGKPAALVTRLQGRSELAPTPQHCAQIGACMARMHEATRDYAPQQPNLRGLDWQRTMIPQLLPLLPAPTAALLAGELAHQLELAPAYAALPRGAVHADLFRDNAMFDDGKLSGVFDWYFAGVDCWLFDLAVALNDWCIDLASGAFDPARRDALLAGYQQQRALLADELRLLPQMLRGAALRFWTSRLADIHLPRDAALLQPHDPRHFERVLQLRIAACA